MLRQRRISRGEQCWHWALVLWFMEPVWQYRARQLPIIDTLPWLTAIPGDAVLKSQAPAILATFFTEKDEQSTAMANAKLWQSLGFAAAFTTGPVMTLWVQSLVTLALWLLASASMWYLHRRVASIDSSTAPSRP